MTNVKRKGNNGELAFATWLRSKGVKAFRDRARGGGNGNKSDINTDCEFGFEVKTVKKLNLQEAWRQCDKASGLNKTVPVLAVHFDGMPKDCWLMVMHSEDWAEYALGGSKSQSSTFTDPRAKLAVQRLVEASRAILKHFEV